jgi:hypothetical protein
MVQILHQVGRQQQTASWDRAPLHQPRRPEKTPTQLGAGSAEFVLSLQESLKIEATTPGYARSI